MNSRETVHLPIFMDLCIFLKELCGKKAAGCLNNAHGFGKIFLAAG